MGSDLDTCYLEPKWCGLVFGGLTLKSRGHEGALGICIYNNYIMFVVCILYVCGFYVYI